MPISPIFKVPTYRCLRGRAITKYRTKVYYLGDYGSKESKQKYAALLAQWAAQDSDSPSTTPDDLRVAELLVLFRRHAVKHYRKRDGKVTRSLANIDDAIRPLRLLYARERVVDFGPKRLKAIQNLLVQGYTDQRGNKMQPLGRKTINKRIGIIKQVFAWGVSEELCPPSLDHALRTVRGLQAGRTDAHECQPIRPIDDATVMATIPFLPPVVASMVQLQRLLGCRPGELVILRPCDVDRTGKVWTYKPESHKTEHHGRQRLIFIGPKAQVLLRPYLLRAADAYCFVPSESEGKRRESQHAARKTPLSCGNRPGTHRVRKPKRRPGDRYDTNGYARAVLRACDLADRAAHKAAPTVPTKKRLVERWAPNRLRHTLATEVRKQYGLEASSCVLGHATARISEIYAERDFALAARVAAEVG